MTAITMCRGFTLIELMLSLAVAALVFTLGVPSFQELIETNRMVTQINEFAADFNLARSEALRRATPITMCKRNSAGTACDNSAAWLGGWLVFVDPNGNGSIDQSEQILRSHLPFSGLTRVNLSRTLNRITVDAMGMTPGYNVTISFCDSRGVAKAKGRILSNTGRLRAATAGDTLNCS